MEVKELADKIQGAVDSLHQADGRRTEEMKLLGYVTAETKNAMDKINEHIDELETKMQRMALVKPQIDGLQPLSEEKEAHRSAFFKWLRYGKSGLEPQERKALVEDTTGLYIVPEDVEAEIIRAIPAINVMRKLCNIRTTSRDKIKTRSITEVSVGWGKLETGTDITESTLVPSTGNIYVEDLYGLTKVGEDELMDTDVNLTGIIADSFSRALAEAEEAAFLIGTGHTYQEPAGLAVDTTLLGSIGSGAGVGASGTYGNNWSGDDTVTIDDVLECEYSLPAQYLNGSAWLMHRKTELAMRVLKEATTGGYLWQPSLQIGEPNSFDGYPVYNSANLQYPADTLAGTNVIFGNFKAGYTILDRAGMSMQRLDELYAEAGLVGFKVHMRVGGGIVRYAPFQIIANDT